ncbi:hypothetical protein MNV49_004708 [Pseudohyphozyma bogoriensis]|nr:hypothetical protein MNV49_004708 [Pseudohyphozyma bogoriensis]
MSLQKVSTEITIETLNPSAAHGDADHPPAKKRIIKPREVPLGAIVTEKSCIKCDRLYPLCKHCKDRNEECDLKDLLPKPKEGKEESERIKKLEKRLAELESQLPSSSSGTSSNTLVPTHSAPYALPSSVRLPVSTSTAFPDPFSLFLESSHSSDTSGDSPPLNSNIGPASLDWRLATPQMEKSLTRSLCDAFFESCCFLLPSFAFYKNKLLDGSGGYRISSVELDRWDPVESEVGETNLACLLAVSQLNIFNELEPKKSRSLLRAALGQFKDLQDAAASDKERKELKKVFGFAIYTADCLTSATANRSPLISDSDLQTYFSHAGIVLPTLPSVALTPVLQKLLVDANAPSPSNKGQGVDAKFKTATHLIACWTAALQRMFLKTVGVGVGGGEGGVEKVRELWKVRIVFQYRGRWGSIDETRTAIQYLQSIVFASPSLSTPHTHSHSHSHNPESPTHIHETDYVSLAIRSDRDLLDLISLTHKYLLRKEIGGEWGELRRESESRVRKGLKAMAFYFKVYLTGADGHMIYHAVFQMEHNPNWVQMALQRLGDTPGPKDESEEVSQVELGCAEKRLAEISPRFSVLPNKVDTPPSAVLEGPASPFSDFDLNSFLASPHFPTSTSLPTSAPTPPAAETLESLFAGITSPFPLPGTGGGGGAGLGEAESFDLFAREFASQQNWASGNAWGNDSGGTGMAGSGIF